MQNITDNYVSEKPLTEDEYYRKELARESERDRYFWERHQPLTDINLEKYDNEKGLAAWISSEYKIDPINAEQSINLARQKIRNYVYRKRYPLIAKARRYRQLKKKLTKREKRELKKQLPLAKAEIKKLNLVLSLIIRNGSNRQQSILELAQTFSRMQNGTTTKAAPNSSKSTIRSVKNQTTKETSNFSSSAWLYWLKWIKKFSKKRLFD